MIYFHPPHTQYSLLYFYIEKKIYSKKYNYAGTLDLICTTKKSNELTLIDWKTSKAIYDNYIYQPMAYKFAFEEETGEKIKSMKIIRIPKNGGNIEIKDIKWNKTHFKTSKNINPKNNFGKILFGKTTETAKHKLKG